MATGRAIEVDLAVVGAGMAGMCAAFFAAEQGIATAQIGGPSELPYAAGPWDLLAVHPLEERRRWVDPWKAIARLVHDEPRHPYRRIALGEIRAAFDALLGAVAEAGLPYERARDENSEILTSIGTTKSTYGLPRSMWHGVRARAEQLPCLIVGIAGLRDFSATQIVEVAQAEWPELRACRIELPELGPPGELSPEFVARSLDEPHWRARLAEAIHPRLANAKCVGLPAVVGYERSAEAVADLEAALGVPLFEIPMPPVSVPGLRLRDAFDRLLERRRVVRLAGRRVAAARSSSAHGFELDVVDPGDEAGTTVEQVVRAKGVVLATGRFLGGGLSSDRKRVRETLFDLPVSQPSDRRQWHRPSMLDPRGHPINLAGLETDDELRPLDAAGRPAFPGLFAAGSILAHQDWPRSKSGAGLAIATARGAVNAFRRYASS